MPGEAQITGLGFGVSDLGFKALVLESTKCIVFQSDHPRLQVGAPDLSPAISEAVRWTVKANAV